MINLLPEDQKQSIKYARYNTKLLHWAIIALIVITGLLAIVFAGKLYIQASTTTYSKQIEKARQELQSNELEETKQQISELSNNVKLIDNVLSRQILFSKLLRQAGSVMPAGTVLSSIDLTEVEGGIDLSAQAKDYKSATQVQVNLEDPSNKLFEKVDIVTISCSESKESVYPCTANIRALFADSSPYLFTNENLDEGTE